MNARPLYIDVHVLQTVPPSNINRDDTGSPKTARFGGVTRARVSSQAWKRATRESLAGLLDEAELGQRTFHAADMIRERIQALDPAVAPEKAAKLAAEALGATGVKVTADKKSGADVTGYLLFVSPSQADGLARLALESMAGESQIDKKRAREVLDVKKSPVLNAVDIALFGRMVADAPDLNVDASVQVAHAIGVGRAEPEFDYFTAMDDRSPEDTAGAGMIGTVEFNSSTLYRYATVDVAHLCENLGSPQAAVRALGAFLRAFVTSMPTGKQNSFANRTLPDAVLFQARDTQPVNLSGAFELPVAASAEKSQAALACERLVAREKAVEEAFGVEPLETQAVCAAPGAEALAELAEGGRPTSLEEAVARMEARTASYLGAD